MPTISAVLIVKNEERHMRACLELLTWADEIVVVDSFSSDATLFICHQFTDKVYCHPFFSLPQQRNIALGYAQGDWIWVMDADERMTPPLQQEIQETMGREDAGPHVGYWVPRQNIILGKWLRHGGWYPDYQLRLFRRGLVRYNEAYQGHERVIVSGETGYLKQTYLHYNYESLRQLFAKQEFYSHLASRSLHSFGVRARPQNFVLQPLREFRRRYLELEGYKDGGHGLLMALAMAWYHLRVYTKLLRLGGMEWSFGRRRWRPVDDAL